MGGGSGGGGGGQVSTTQPWGGQQRYLKNIYRRAQDLSYGELPFYPGETLAPRSEATLEGERMIRERAGAGDPLTEQARGYYGDVMSGRYMEGNPWLDKMYARASENVGEQFRRIAMPALETRFARAGRTGGGTYHGAMRMAGGELADRLAQLGEDIYSKDYVRERGYMEQAARGAPAMEAAGYLPGERMREVGAAEESYAQRAINELIRRYEYTQTEPWQRLGRYSSLIGQPVMEQESGPLSPNLAMAQGIMGMLQL